MGRTKRTTSISLGRSTRITAAVLSIVLLLGGVSTYIHLEVPPGTGPYLVGRTTVTWTDPDRPESRTSRPNDNRVVAATFWYPAITGTGVEAPYVHDLADLDGGLVASGELSRVEVAGLAWVREGAIADADPAPTDVGHPLVVLSPGNATNVAFYASLAEELASHGYVVLGVDHPYQVAAVALPDGMVAAYRDRNSFERAIDDDIVERVEDIRFALDQVSAGSPAFLGDSVDADHIGIVGHSNGGLAAAEACRQDRRFDACVNLDGQNLGGPFGHRVTDGAPEQPFMFLTKETDLHPEMHRRFESAGAGAVRVVVPSAHHDDFTDGSLFLPGLDPTERRPDRVHEITRGFVTAFLDHWLRGAQGRVFEGVQAGEDVYVNVYPLGSNAPLPIMG